MMSIAGYVLACRSYSFVHYTIASSSLCKLIWRHWIYKMPVRYILSGVWVRLSIFSQLSIIRFMWLCVQFTHFPCDDWEKVHFVFIIIIKSEVWTIIHCLGLCHEIMVSAVSLPILLPRSFDIAFCKLVLSLRNLNGHFEQRHLTKLVTRNNRQQETFIRKRPSFQSSMSLLMALHRQVLGYWQAMMTSSNGNIFRVTGPLCGEFTGAGEFPTQRPVTRSFDVSFDLRLNKRLSKQPWGWWFETPTSSLWRHCNALFRLVLG